MDDYIDRGAALAEIEFYRRDWANARDAIAALPAVDPTAIREEALREAVEILDDEGWLGMSKHRILALLDKGAKK